MYKSYEENSGTVTLETLPIVEFMNNSLVEIFMLDQNLAYNHAFMHIRQLALQLRNATTSKTKVNENFQHIEYFFFYIIFFNRS